MLLVHKKDDGYIYSFFEFNIVDSKGNTKNQGEYMYVRDIWVHPNHDGKKEISRFITESEENEQTISVKHIYWLRTKWVNGKVISKRLSRPFTRKTCLKHKENHND